jgi:hypothetical protein
VVGGIIMLRVLILKAKNPEKWYSKYIGEIFEVYTTLSNWDGNFMYFVNCQYNPGKLNIPDIPFILLEDCKVIREVRKMAIRNVEGGGQIFEAVTCKDCEEVNYIPAEKIDSLDENSKLYCNYCGKEIVV